MISQRLDRMAMAMVSTAMSPILVTEKKKFMKTRAFLEQVLSKNKELFQSFATKITEVN